MVERKAESAKKASMARLELTTIVKGSIMVKSANLIGFAITESPGPWAEARPSSHKVNITLTPSRIPSSTISLSL